MWRELSELYEKSETKNNFFEDVNVKKLFAEIDTIIDTAFSQALENKDLFNTLDPSKKLSNWFDQMSTNGNFLMVRSTGSEDTRKMANAGGNVSEHYVKPEREEFCNASRKVVESYFNQRSLQNQINLGINPFAEELKLAVSVQELIGEELGGTSDVNMIPKSAVLFTNEPFYVGNEKFRVMRLSCTYGHGEAVVDNLDVATDTVLLLNSVTDPSKLYILYDNQAKKFRLAPVKDPETGKISLQKIPNDPSIVNKQVFDDQMLARIYQWGVIGEKVLWR